MQSQKVNKHIIIKVTGMVLIIEGLFMLSCLPVSIHFGGEDFLSILISGVFILILGAILWYLKRSVNQKDVSKKDGHLIVVLIWVVMSLFGALPFYISGYIPSYTDAFFETISGFSTTGATILTDIEVLPKGLLFWRSFTQWIGGLGIIVFTVAVLPLFGFGGMNIFTAEAPCFAKERLHPRIVVTARRLWVIYLSLTLVQIALLMIGKMNWYEAVCHSFTTVSTGGFSPLNSSIAGYSTYIQYIIIIFMLLGGISFPLYYFFLKKQFSKIFKNEELQFYLVVIIIASLFITIGLFVVYGGDIEKSLRTALFQVTSIITTTGYITSDYMIWPSYLWFIIFLLMFFGGMTGSTSGGLKMMRYLILFKNVKNEFKRLMHPNAIINVRFMGKVVPRETIINILSLFIIYMLAFGAGVIILVSFGLNFADSCGSAISCINAVGPGLGSTGAIGNYAHLHDISKWTLSTLMLMGRLEFFAFLIVLSPTFWKK
jgi:trk system potassium uptake protein TrkH